MRLARLTAAVLVLAACRSPAEPASPTPDGTGRPSTIVAGVVTAVRVSGGVRLTNGDDSPVAYAVWNPNFLGLFGACTSTDASCPRLGPGASITVSDDQVVGAVPGMKRVVVRWWHVAGGEADAVREVEVGW